MSIKIENPYVITWYSAATGSSVLAQTEYATAEECQRALNEILNSYEFKEATLDIAEKSFSFMLR